jgi:hypothetical protein
MSRTTSRAGSPFKSLLKFRSYGALVFALVLAFYVAWPLYAGYDIKSSLEAGNPAGLNAHVDFPSVRVSLRPSVEKKVDGSSPTCCAGPGRSAARSPIRSRRA